LPLYAGWRSIFDNFLRLKTFTGYLDAALTVILMICVFVILVASARAWLRAIRGEPVTFVAATAGPDHSHIPGSGCC
jgi:hypothetical protein